MEVWGKVPSGTFRFHELPLDFLLLLSSFDPTNFPPDGSFQRGRTRICLGLCPLVRVWPVLQRLYYSSKESGSSVVQPSDGTD